MQIGAGGRRRTSLVPSLVAVLFLAGAAADAGASTRLLVLGDSISAGYGIDIADGWVRLLADRLDDTLPGSTVVNASVSGETTSGGVVRLPGALERHSPDLVIIELGGNDGLRGYPIARIRDNLTRMVSQAREAGAEVLLIGMFVPPNYGERYMNGFHQSFHEVAAATDSALVPFLLDGVATDPELMQDDGIHPTAAAQGLLLENVWPTLTRMLDIAGDGAVAASDNAGP